MEEAKKKNKVQDHQGALNGFSPVSDSPPVFWKSRKRSAFSELTENDEILPFCSYINYCSHEVSASVMNMFKDVIHDATKTPKKQEEHSTEEKMEDSTLPAVLSERRKALFEPLEPIVDINGRRPSAESILPPPDFDSASYPRGWLIGKKRKLVNVDVVESMRRIAVQEMNRKDREIDGLNEQLEEDSRCLEHLQLQLLDERSKRADVERQNTMLQNQVNMLMNMLQDNENMDDEEGAGEP